MKSHQLFCSACDREVHVMIAEAAPEDHQATLHDEEVVCLEIGGKCSGALCPIGATAPHAMVGRLMRNGLPVDKLEMVSSACPSYGLTVDFVLYGSGKAACTACGSPARWSMDHAEPMG